jgi:hypothetical protein
MPPTGELVRFAVPGPPSASADGDTVAVADRECFDDDHDPRDLGFDALRA